MALSNKDCVFSPPVCSSECNPASYFVERHGLDVGLPFDTTSTTLSWHAYWQRGVSPLGA